MMTSESFQTLSILASDSDPRVHETVELLASVLTGRGLTVYVDEATEFSEFAAVKSCAEVQLADHCDLMIAVGGDGTMLRAAKLITRVSLPLLGINRGRRGFLADIAPDDVEETVCDILDGDYLRESRMMLDATLSDESTQRPIGHALNDVVIQRGAMGQMLDFEVHVDGAYVTTHRGDGLIVATPTGSTAYALSSGGPIVQPGLNAVSMVPICPHTLSDRPLLIPGNSCIDIRIRHRFDADAYVTVDGAKAAQVYNGSRLTVTQSVRRVTLLHPSSYDYFEVLRSKLNWSHYGASEKA